MNCTIENIYYYPIKSGNNVALDKTNLTFAGIVGDRKWALVSPNYTALPNGEWMPCDSLERFKIQPKMATWKTDVTDTGIRLTVEGQDFHIIESEKVVINDRQVQLVRANKGYWDDKDASISIINLNTIEAISKAIGIELDPIRFRANIYVRAEPLSELHWLGKQLHIGEATLQITMPTDRCRAISVDPDTGEITHNIPAQLAKHFGHTYCGVYATVIEEGEIKVGALGQVQDETMLEQNKLEQLDIHYTNDWPRSVQVVDIIEEADGIRSLWLRDSLAQMGVWESYKEGQHVRLHGLKTDSELSGTWRSYTVSKRQDDLFRITVKRGDGEGSKHIHSLKVNDKILMTGPKGELTVPKQATSLYFMTAGIGITPAIAMLAGLTGFEGAIHFIHTTKLEQLALWHEIEDFACERANVNCTLFISNTDISTLKNSTIQANFSSKTLLKSGRPDMTQLAQRMHDEGAHVIVCGPSNFSSKILTALETENIPIERIGSETFISASIDAEFREPTSKGPHTVRFTQSDIEATWQASDGTLLDLAEQHGLIPTSHCRAGICGVCKVDLSAGKVEQLAGNVLSDNNVLLCCSVPVGNVEIKL